MLVAIKPSFVEDRSQRQNPLEQAPISYKRVMVFTGLVTLLVVVIPIVWEYNHKLARLFQQVKSMVRV